MPDRPPSSAPHAVHWPGSPQGRRPEEPGPHGCSLVQVDDERQARITLIPCDVLRWHSEQVTLDPAAGVKDLERRLHDRMKALGEASPGIDLLVSFSIVAAGPLAGQLRRGSLAAQLLRTLRSEFGTAEPAVWTVLLSAETAPTLPAQWYEQDTIRGDFLREVRRLQSAGGEPIRLDDRLGEALRGPAGADGNPRRRGPPGGAPRGGGPGRRSVEWGGLSDRENPCPGGGRIWRLDGLRLDPLGEQLTVFYGPNEAGKTTLLQFIRSVLYGFSAERRRYLPPVHGGQPGGSLWVSRPGRRLRDHAARGDKGR